MNRSSLVFGGGIILLGIVLFRTRESAQVFERRNNELQQELASAKAELQRRTTKAAELPPTHQKLPPDQFSELLRLRSEVTLLRSEVGKRPTTESAPDGRPEAEAARRGGRESQAGQADGDLVQYIGEPVEPPQDLDARYGTAGLLSAVETASRNAGIALEDLRVDDREFPFVVGVRAKDASKLIEEIKKMGGYEYGGSVSGDGVYAFNITPRSAWPSAASQRIDRRLGLRMRAWYERVRGGG